jgi:hypothetical protein
MSREGQDGINTDAVLMDHNIPVVAYYIDGRYAWTPVEIALFPNSVHIQIATRYTTNAGNFLDVENGDATPAQAAVWANQRRLSGYEYPGIYCSRDAQQSVINAFNNLGVDLPGWWIADWDGVDRPELPTTWGKQYASTPHYDKTIWEDFIPGVDTAMDQNTLIPFPNADGTVVNVPLGTIWENADLYGGKAMNAVLDPNTGTAAIAHKLDILNTAVATLTSVINNLTGAGTLSGTATVTVDLTPKGTGA